MGRILFDVGFTRTQRHPSGIPRTVTKLGGALARVPGVELVPVACHAGRLRRVAGWPPAPGAAPTGPAQELRPSWWVGRAARWVSARLPTPLRRLAWLAYQRWAFDRHSRNDEPLQARAGDVLLLADGSWNYAIWRAAAQVRAGGGRVVLLVHDIMPIRQPAFCSELFAWGFVRWLRRMLACSDAVICNSRTTEEDLREWAAAEDIALPPTGNFRLGFDAARTGAEGAVRPQLAAFLAGPDACFAAVGSLEPKKDYAFLLDSFDALWACGEPVRLVVAGRPSAQGADVLQRMLAHPEQGRRLLTLTDASDAEIGSLYAGCRALLLTSRYEGFGLPLVEARSQGCAVVANDLPAFRELADAGVDLYPQGSARAFQELVLRHAHSTPGAAVPPMPTFGWDDSAIQCLERMDALLRSPRP